MIKNPGALVSGSFRLWKFKAIYHTPSYFTLQLITSLYNLIFCLSVRVFIGIVWNFSLLGDGFHQYVIWRYLTKYLPGTDILQHKWTGFEFYAALAIIWAVLSPFVFFFDSLSMVDSVYLFTLIKNRIDRIVNLSFIKESILNYKNSWSFHCQLHLL